MTEQQWIARARHGDADAFEQLVVAYEGPVYRLALRMCGSAEDAREVTQTPSSSWWWPTKGRCTGWHCGCAAAPKTPVR